MPPAPQQTGPINFGALQLASAIKTAPPPTPIDWSKIIVTPPNPFTPKTSTGFAQNPIEATASKPAPIPLSLYDQIKTASTYPFTQNKIADNNQQAAAFLTKVSSTLDRTSGAIITPMAGLPLENGLPQKFSEAVNRGATTAFGPKIGPGAGLIIGMIGDPLNLIGGEGKLTLLGKLHPDDAAFLVKAADAIKGGQLLKPQDWELFQHTLAHYSMETPQTQEKAADFIHTALASDLDKAMTKSVSQPATVNPSKVDTTGLKPQPRQANGWWDSFKKAVTDQRGFVKNPFAKFGGFPDISTRIIDDLKGRTTVSKQYLLDATNRPELKQAERDLVRNLLKDEPDTINATDFANKIKTELLPLGRGFIGKSAQHYESIALPDSLRGPIANYGEHYYSSPIKTSAGDVHFSGNNIDNYFAHTRIEDLPSEQGRADLERIASKANSPISKLAQATRSKSAGETRRVIELQSDLFQKGRLEAEKVPHGEEYGLALKEAHDRGFVGDEAHKLANKWVLENKDLSKLEPYRNTWQERIIREEVKQAAKDGKTKLQFPTGETAMKIEGLGETNNWYIEPHLEGIASMPISEVRTAYNNSRLTPESLKVGAGIRQGGLGGGEWIITDVLGDGKFKAVEKSWLERRMESQSASKEEALREAESIGRTETFDISGKVDTNNPIYKFYEKEVGKYLTNKYGAKLVTDKQGVKWWEVDVLKEEAKQPIGAFGGLKGQRGFIKNPFYRAPTPEGEGLPKGGGESVPSSQSITPAKTPESLPQKAGSTPESSTNPTAGGGNPPRSPSLEGTLPPENDPVNKIIQALKEAKPLRGKQEKIYSKIRSQQTAKIASIGSKMGGEQGYFSQLGSLKGEMPKVQFESVRPNLSQGDVDTLFNRVEQTHTLLPFEKITAKGGLAKLLGAEGGHVPTEGELRLLKEVFPPEFVDTVLEKRPLMQKMLSMGEQILNLPRSIMSTADLSAPLRQGVFLIGHPKQFAPAFKDMLKYAFSEKAYDGLMEGIKARPTYLAMRDGKLALTETGTQISSREERFASNLAEKIPGFGSIAKGSNRAYTGFLNKLRADVFDDLYSKAKGLGLDPKEVQGDIAKFVNAASGRGDLGALNRAAVTLNGLFFSPRLMASRLNLLNPMFYAKLDPFVRKEALKSLLTFAGTAATITTLAKAGGANIGTDPRSADFGKIKVGNTRYDPWGGFQQYIVAASRLITGQMVSSTSGKEFNLGTGYKPTTRLDIIQRMLESKESPVASFAEGLLKGQDFAGAPFDVPSAIVDRFIPMIASDIFDVAQERGPNAIPMAIPGIFGVGVQTYADKIPFQTPDSSGKMNLGWRPAPSLGETIVNKATGGSVSNIPQNEWQGLQSIQKMEQTNTDASKAVNDQAAKEWQTIQSLGSAQEKKAYLTNIARTDPELAKKIITEAKKPQGLNATETKLLSASTATRAAYIAQEFKTMTTNEQKKAYIQDLYVKKIATKEVVAALAKLLKQ